MTQQQIHYSTFRIFLYQIFVEIVYGWITVVENKGFIKPKLFSGLALNSKSFFSANFHDHWAREWLNRMILHCITHNIVQILQVFL